MSLSAFNSLRRQLRYASMWAMLLILTVTVASVFPELAFTWAVSLSSSFSCSCSVDGYVRIPLDMPAERVCLPARMVKRSSVDFFIPTVFATLIVSSSALMLRSWGISQN